jgi:hypothetical protein
MWAAVAVLAVAGRRSVAPWTFRLAVAIIGIGVVGQLAHVQEHVAQVGIWVAHPNSPPGMTPWGDALARGLGQVSTSRPTLGMEVLHLLGNFVFLAGLAGVVLVTRRALHTRARRWAVMGTWMQFVHGLEHLALTLSIAFGAKQAIGMSTFFGLLEPGPGLWTYRVWWHFLANVLGTAVYAVALRHLWRERHEITAGRADTAPVRHLHAA